MENSCVKCVGGRFWVAVTTGLGRNLASAASVSGVCTLTERSRILLPRASRTIWNPPRHSLSVATDRPSGLSVIVTAHASPSIRGAGGGGTIGGWGRRAGAPARMNHAVFAENSRTSNKTNDFLYCEFPPFDLFVGPKQSATIQQVTDSISKIAGLISK